MSTRNHCGFGFGRVYRPACALVAAAVLTAWVPAAAGYNCPFFGGRLGRPGVTTGPAGTNDFLYSWSVPDNGTLTWYLDRDQLALANCDAACFAALKALVQPELDKWSLWLRVSFAEAPNLASADVHIHFINIASGGADAGPVLPGGVMGTTLLQAEIRIDPDQHADWSTNAAQADFCYTILHEWGHVLGLGDLYFTNHGDSSFEGEDFCDHGLPSGPPPAGAPGLPDTRTKADNVMETFGVKTLDNDSIHGAEWLWGCSGSNGIVTGELAFRTGSNNANEAAAHHGLTQTPMTWTYRGSVAASGGPAKATLKFLGILAARNVGPGAWTPTIYPDRVEFDNPGPYEGNFKFEIDCDQGPERLGDAIVQGSSTTNFTATPAGGGPQLFPFDQVFGADCGELIYIITCTNSTGTPASSLELNFAPTSGPLTVNPMTVLAPGCPPPVVSTFGSTIAISWGGNCIPPGATVSLIASRPNSPNALAFSTGTWANIDGDIGSVLDGDIYIDCFIGRVPNGPRWTIRVRTRYKPVNPVYSPWFHPAGNCWFRWCCWDKLECFYRVDLYVFKSAFNRFFGLRRCIPLVGWKKFRELPAGWILVRQTWPPDGVVINGPIGPPPNVGAFFPNDLTGSMNFEEEVLNSDDTGDTYRSGANLASAFLNARNALNIVVEGVGPPPPPPPSFEAMMMTMAPGYCGAAEALQPLIDEINLISIDEPDPLLDDIRIDIELLQLSLTGICNQKQTGIVLDPIPFQDLGAGFNALAQHLMMVPTTEPRFQNAAEHLLAIDAGMDMADVFVSANMYDGINDLNERDQFLWTQVARLPNEMQQFAKAVDAHGRIDVDLLPPTFQSWQAEDQGEALVQVADRDQIATDPTNTIDEFTDRLSEFGSLVVRRPDRADGVDEEVPLRVRFKYPRHLSRVVDVPPGDGATVSVPALIAGYVNDDDCIDAADLNQVLADQGQGGPFAPQVPSSDVNGDGIVNNLDLNIVQQNMAQCGQQIDDCVTFQFDLDGSGVLDDADVILFVELLLDGGSNVCAPEEIDGRTIQDFVDAVLG